MCSGNFKAITDFLIFTKKFQICFNKLIFSGEKVRDEYKYDFPTHR